MEKPTIFISHITQEKEIARSIKEFLENKFLKTINVFASSHEESIQLGDDWISTIKKSMTDCKLIILLCSPLSITRPWVNFEAGAGWIRNIPVIPLCHSGITPGKLPVPINSFQGGLLNNKEDMIKVFNRIAKILDINTPKIEEDSFFNAISLFENDIRNSSLVKDTTFINNLISQQIVMLKFNIYASTLDYNKLNKVNLDTDCFNNFKFTFNDTYNLLNTSLVMITLNKKIFKVYYETLQQISENIKFILTYSRIEIAPNIEQLFDEFLFYFSQTNLWYDGVQMLDANTELRKELIKMIKDEPLPPKKRSSNMLNYFIDYYESLIYFKDWVISLETEISKILE